MKNIINFSRLKKPKFLKIEMLKENLIYFFKKFNNIKLIRQVTILLWKNYQIRRRQKLRLIIEIILPLIVFIMLAIMRQSLHVLRSPECHFLERSLPSNGLIPFLSSFLCSLKATCSQRVQNSSALNSKLFNLIQLGDGYLNALNQPNASQLFDNLNQAAQLAVQIRQLSTNTTRILSFIF